MVYQSNAVMKNTFASSKKNLSFIDMLAWLERPFYPYGECEAADSQDFDFRFQALAALTCMTLFFM
ncbi:hypothetical protein [Neobacillus cucumis]|uniref:hypothetical protein n=1 Tax=Neobacillus cucumis TaxID=1740721 RepID=UPI0028534472|nr:hypothetical protein [Neobacillus cucumis]MDR4949767.1 hypothetical protein [Neobacillus cucumis]